MTPLKKEEYAVQLEVAMDDVIDKQLLEEHIAKVRLLRSAEVGDHSVVLKTENYTLRGKVELCKNKTVPGSIEKRDLPKVVFIEDETPGEIGCCCRLVPIVFIDCIKPVKSPEDRW